MIRPMACLAMIVGAAGIVGSLQRGGAGSIRFERTDETQNHLGNWNAGDRKIDAGEMAGKESTCTSSLIKMARRERASSPKSPRLIQMAHAVLRRAVSQAVKLGLIARNVCDAVERPKAQRHEIEPLTVAQAGAFLKAAETDRLYAMYVIAIAGGLRQGELYGLKRDDIDLAGGAVTVRRTLLELDGEFLEGPPKSQKGNRKIKLPAFAVDALRAHLAKMLAEGNAAAGYLFCDHNGGPLRRQNVLRRSFRPILKAAGCPTIRFHDLRHTSAALMLAQKIHPKVVQERLGHSQISVTLDTYSHVLEGMDDEAAEKLGDVLSRTGS
jgi:integrase